MYKIFTSILLLALMSCSSPNPEDIQLFSPSNEFISSNVRFQEIDTISFKMSTFKIDSLATDIFSKILVGRYIDPQFGKVTCNGFINFVPNNYDFYNDAVFDSIVLNLRYEKYHYNDTLLQKKINVYTIQKKLDYRNGQINFYNTTDFTVGSLIGQKTFYPRIKKDSLKITLNNTFGQDIFNKIKDGQINNNEELAFTLKGLKIAADNNENASIITFTANTTFLRFYYSTPDDTGEAKFYDFKYTDFNTNRNHFSQILSDRTGTILPVNFINQENEIKSQNTNNLTFIQGGIGIVTKISFPNFKESILNLNSKGTMYKASLKIPLNKIYYSKKLFTSDVLSVYMVDQNNEIVRKLQDATIVVEDAEFNKSYINVPVQPFLEEVLKINYYKNYGLILLPVNYGAVTTRLILNDNINTNEKSKLKITYLTYEN